MGYRRITTGKIYHIFNRGCDKRNVFLNKEGYFRFITSLIRFNTTKRVDLRNQLKIQSVSDNLVLIDCFCLMPNHFHILLKELVEGGLSKFMQKLGCGFTNYFNAKYKRSGVLFQGEFKSVEISDDLQLEHIRKYIKHNPVSLINNNYKSKDLLNGKIELSREEVEFINNYPYSKFYKLL